MNREKIKEKLYKIIAENLGVNLDCIAEEKSFQDDLTADSLDEIEIVMSVEEEFGIEIKPDQAELIKTVGDAIDAITAHFGVAIAPKCAVCDDDSLHCNYCDKQKVYRSAKHVSECWGWLNANENTIQGATFCSSTAAFAEMCGRLSIDNSNPGAMNQIYMLGFKMVTVEKKLTVMRVLD